jgi:hypothetical protein
MMREGYLLALMEKRKMAGNIMMFLMLKGGILPECLSKLLPIFGRKIRCTPYIETRKVIDLLNDIRLLGIINELKSKSPKALASLD